MKRGLGRHSSSSITLTNSMESPDRTGDRILTIDARAVHDPVGCFVLPHNRAGGRCCGGLGSGAA